MGDQSDIFVRSALPPTRVVPIGRSAAATEDTRLEDPHGRLFRHSPRFQRQKRRRTPNNFDANAVLLEANAIWFEANAISFEANAISFEADAISFEADAWRFDGNDGHFEARVICFEGNGLGFEARAIPFEEDGVCRE